MRQVPEAAAGARYATVARRTGPADLRERLRAGVEAVGRADEDDPQRVPADALAEGSAGVDRQAHGGFLLRGERRPPPRFRAAADQVISRGRPPSRYGYFPVDLK